MSARYAVLALLLDRPGHPYDLAARFDQRVGRAWGLKRGQVYLLLDRLREERLVELAESQQVGGRTRSVYRATEAGRDAFERWLLSRDAGPVPPLRSDLLIKLSFGAPEHAPHLLELVSERMQQSHELLQEYSEAARRSMKGMPSSVPWRDLLPEVLYGAAILHLEAEIHWLTRVRAYLQSYMASGQMPEALRAELAAGHPGAVPGTPPGRANAV